MAGMRVLLPAGGIRIRSGQRRLIFATARMLGLRDEQLYDLVESASDGRTRAIAHLTIGEARWTVGVLKTLERNGARLALEAARCPARMPDVSEELLRKAVRRGGAA